MKTIIEVDFYNSKKARVKLEDGFTFALYRGELRKYKLSQGAIINEEMLDDIVKNILCKRGKERALYMLKNSAKTKHQVIDKLKREYYPQLVIDYVVDFLEKYNYLNDVEYAKIYIQKLGESSSIKRLILDLKAKGISKEDIDNALDGIYIDNSKALKKIIEKKIHRYDINLEKDRRKFFSLLLRNGFSYEEIVSVIREIK